MRGGSQIDSALHYYQYSEMNEIEGKRRRENVLSEYLGQKY